MIALPRAWDDWADQAADWFRKQGAASDAAKPFALLYGLASAYGYSPRITSIFRDPEKQRRMRERWDAGDRSGLRARPAVNSKHIETDWLGRPASEAMDMVTTNDQAVARIATEWLDMGAGQFFNTPDPGHYFV